MPHNLYEHRIEWEKGKEVAAYKPFSFDENVLSILFLLLISGFEMAGSLRCLIQGIQKLSVTSTTIQTPLASGISW